MKCLSAGLLAMGLVFAGSASAQNSGYYAAQEDNDYRADSYAEQGANYDYARVLRVDPIIVSQNGDDQYGSPPYGSAPYGSSQYGNSAVRNAVQCRYRDADDVYAGGEDPYRRDDRYGDDRDYRSDDYYGRDDGYRNNGNAAGRTVATVIGGIAGAVLGSKIGDGSGRYVGTAVGSMVGGMAGRSVYDSARRNQPVARRGTVRVCEPVAMNRSDYREGDERVEGYDVTYEYANRTYHTRTNYHPGERIRVRVDLKPE
ncbi:MAG: glycine zipper 2TM domain-containing protein [Pseudoxanthomonas sp.]